VFLWHKDGLDRFHRLSEFLVDGSLKQKIIKEKQKNRGVVQRAWIEVLRATKGVYLLTCPKTKEQYVGSAIGETGFWNRWLTYSQTGHGNNVGLKSRDASDYQLSILEVAGTSSTDDEILRMEERWKRKLQSREMGLNRN